MARGREILTFPAIIMVVALVLFATPMAKAQLITYIDSVTALNNSDSIILHVHIDNYSGDSIMGFTLWISLAYADYIGFYSDSVQLIDTTYENCLEDSCVLWIGGECAQWTCLSWADTTIDSSWVQRGALDTVGTLTSGWDFVDGALLDSENRNLKINAIADQGGPFNPGIASPTSYGTLCRILAEVKPSLPTDSCQVWVGDSLVQLPWEECFCDSIIKVTFDTVQTRFSNSEGQFIGWIWHDTAWTCAFVAPDNHKECVRKCARDSINHCIDSSCYYMYNEYCYLWQCDSCEIWDSSGAVDPEQVFFSHGEIEVYCPTYLCGDANADGWVNVSDAVWIINYVFVGGQPPNPLASGEVNCDSNVNVSDAVWIINYVFVAGKAPCDTTGDGIPDC